MRQWNFDLWAQYNSNLSPDFLQITPLQPQYHQTIHVILSNEQTFLETTAILRHGWKFQEKHIVVQERGV